MCIYIYKCCIYHAFDIIPVLDIMLFMLLHIMHDFTFPIYMYI